jgi:hypothetical protein
VQMETFNIVSPATISFNALGEAVFRGGIRAAQPLKQMRIEFLRCHASPILILLDHPLSRTQVFLPRTGSLTRRNWTDAVIAIAPPVLIGRGYLDGGKT